MKLQAPGLLARFPRFADRADDEERHRQQAERQPQRARGGAVDCSGARPAVILLGL